MEGIWGMTEKTDGARIAVEVSAYPATKIAMYDYGSGVGLRIGEFFGSSVYVRLGFDEGSRHDACDRLIDVLTAARRWTSAEESGAEPAEVPA